MTLDTLVFIIIIIIFILGCIPAKPRTRDEQIDRWIETHRRRMRDDD